jgi:hypothetical protein
MTRRQIVAVVLLVLAFVIFVITAFVGFADHANASLVHLFAWWGVAFAFVVAALIAAGLPLRR